MNSLTFITNCINNQGGPLTVTQLDLSNCNLTQFTPQIKQLLESCPNLYQLKLTNCLLKSLDLLPSLNLEIIDLSQNKLNDSEIHKLLQYKQLKQLSLKNNLIQSLEQLYGLNELKYIGQLDLLGNPLCTSVNDYRKSVFQKLNTLELIDNRLKTGQLMSEEDQEEYENNIFIFDKKYDSQQLDQEDEDIDYQNDEVFEEDFDNDEEFQFDYQGFNQKYAGQKKRKF